MTYTIKSTAYGGKPVGLTKKSPLVMEFPAEHFGDFSFTAVIINSKKVTIEKEDGLIVIYEAVQNG